MVFDPPPDDPPFEELPEDPLFAELPDEHATSVVRVVTAHTNVATDLRCDMSFLKDTGPVGAVGNRLIEHTLKNDGGIAISISGSRRGVVS